jgi:hypothetical protein
MLKNYITLLFLSVSAVFFAQKPLRGTVVCNSKISLEGISVTNTSRNSFSVTNENGFFTIDAAVGDVIKFTSVQCKEKNIVVKQNDFSDNLLVVNVAPMIEVLDEVTVKKSKIDAVSAGILSKPAKKYTPAERRLKTAGDFKPIQLLMIPLGGMPFDPILNAISGRTKMLKAELQVERKEFALQTLTELFEKSYFIEKLHIPADYVKGFQYYAVENNGLRSVLKTRNKTQIDFILSQLSVEYLKNFEEK